MSFFFLYEFWTFEYGTIVEGAGVVEWLCCSTRIHKILCSNLGIITHGMILDKSLTAQLSRMTHSYRTSA